MQPYDGRPSGPRSVVTGVADGGMAGQATAKVDLSGMMELRIFVLRCIRAWYRFLNEVSNSSTFALFADGGAVHLNTIGNVTVRGEWQLEGNLGISGAGWCIVWSMHVGANVD